MDDTFSYLRLRTPVGVKLEIVEGAHSRSRRVWELMARQVYAENGRDGYRAIEHLDCGAPVLVDDPCRISLTHTHHLLAVATLPPTPHIPLDKFDPRTALGIDAEDLGREQVLKVRPRFLQDDEMKLTAAESLNASILAWTAKEAVYKAMLTPGLDFRNAITLLSLPVPVDAEQAIRMRPDKLTHGSARVSLPDGVEVLFELYSLLRDNYAITLAITPHTTTYSSRNATPIYT